MAERDLVPISERSIVTDLVAPTNEMLRILELPEAERQAAFIALEKWLQQQFEVLKGMTQEGEWSQIPAWTTTGAHSHQGTRRVLTYKIGESPLYFDVDGMPPDLITAIFLQKGDMPYMTRAEFHFSMEDDSLSRFSLTDRSLASSVVKVEYGQQDGFTLTKPEPVTRRFPIIRS